ncbi:helix-turn-helix domain-containing protein [Candidatus Clostridium helianthi]|jgi:transcriptional regulator with XRE-family HTH domain|uniref:Helix-turn-helix domain-containing protein n=1 Tax=Candidatus Clostridium helianthi TaxID=3381660 RepID=A0ABW8S2Z9_9CLOT
MVNENIKKAREAAGISQRELGRRINKTGQYISYLEKNPKSNPSIVVLSDIATALNIPLSYLIETQETLTNKIIRTLEINFDADAENTLELICELADIDPEVIDEALKYNEDISESYLSKMISIIYNDNPDLFTNFYIENKNLINSNYLICAQTCDEILKRLKLKGVLDEDNKIKTCPKERMQNVLVSNRIVQNSLLYSFVLSVLISKYHTNSIQDLINKLKFDNIEQLAALITNDAGKYILSAVNASFESLKEDPNDLSFSMDALNSEIENYNSYNSALLSNIKSIVYAENKESE